MTVRTKSRTLAGGPPAGEDEMPRRKGGSFPKAWCAGVPHSPFFARCQTRPMLHSKTLFSEVKAGFDLSVVLSIGTRNPPTPNLGWQRRPGLVCGCTGAVVSGESEIPGTPGICWFFGNRLVDASIASFPAQELPATLKAAHPLLESRPIAVRRSPLAVPYRVPPSLRVFPWMLPVVKVLRHRGTTAAFSAATFHALQVQPLSRADLVLPTSCP